MTISYIVLVHHSYILVVTLHIDIIPLHIGKKKLLEDEGHFLTVQNAMEEYTTDSELNRYYLFGIFAVLFLVF